MHDRQLRLVSRQLQRAIGRSTLRRLGEDSGFIIRERTITADRFLPSLLKSLAAHDIETIADLVRDFNFDHGCTVHYKPYYEKLDTPCFPRLMQALFQTMLDTLCVQVLAPMRNGPFARFDDIIIQDGTSFALHDDLSEVFDGRFTTISPAAVELHCTMSLLGDNLVSTTLTPDSECERHHVPCPSYVAGKLILADRGFDGLAYMEEVNRVGGHFLIRAKKSLDPCVFAIRGRRGSLCRRLEGKRLRRVLQRLPKGKPTDMDVRWEVDGKVLRAFRLVVQWNPVKKEWIRLLTNLDRQTFSAHAIVKTYRLRWQIELLFKELKSYANLHRFSTAKAAIAEGLIWASLAAAFLKRYLAHACQRVLGEAISTRASSMCGHHILCILFASMKRRFRDLADRLSDIFAFLRHNARRSRPKRDRQTGRLSIGLRLSGVRT